MIATTPCEVTLTTEHMQRAVYWGQRRFNEAVRLGARDKQGASRAHVQRHVEGCLGELAVRVLLGLRLDPMSVNTFKRVPDIAPDIEVRLRTTPHGELIIRPDDVEGRRYVLVQQQAPLQFHIPGWCWRGEAAERGTWCPARNGWRACWFIPAEQLTSMEELR